ncbi:phenolic glucoside malonyltransferase 1-like [Mercurialis annua]|uniref:phenolic glucoside malonyltransferase 1-like n=1 Tax=Mercurialis annua TaxID=3986 RepID=UPI002160CEB2|nr:phenolic glucoside malonyltransferase 1-like [Mercurialis annua]
MESSKNSTLRVLEVCQVTPSPDSPESAAELSLPLTFFDTFWIKFHPVERIFFYQLTGLTSAHFISVILPKLKTSLSLALLHYLPVAGNLVWPSDAAKPFILYTPQNDSVSITVAESDADFNHLSGNEIRETVQSHPFIPELPVDDSTASIIAFQVTIFPGQGFCIGVSSHHAILDGKSVTMFLKAWAQLCKSAPISLPPELTPFFDRTIVQDPEGIDMVYLNEWLNMAPGGYSKSLKQFPNFGPSPESDRVRGTFELSREDIKKLRQKILSDYQLETSSMHLSAFVLSFAYTALAIFKAKGFQGNKKVLFGINADCRNRLDPPLPANYFGNCVSTYIVETEGENIIRENGLLFAVEKLSEGIKRLEKGALDGAKEKISYFKSFEPGSVEGVGVAGSPKFGVYSMDFGWGKPKKVEVTSIDRTIGTISMAESRDGSGGVEVGVVLTKHDMENFNSLFVNGLKDL